MYRREYVEGWKGIVLCTWLFFDAAIFMAIALFYLARAVDGVYGWYTLLMIPAIVAAVGFVGLALDLAAYLVHEGSERRERERNRENSAENHLARR
jgi:uncharacterized membrane protein